MYQTRYKSPKNGSTLPPLSETLKYVFRKYNRERRKPLQGIDLGDMSVDCT